MFDPVRYLATRRPLAEAETLPGHCYTSDLFFQRERQQIFAGAWHFVGREDEIPNPGDFLVVDTVVGSALVCRDPRGALAAFANACRHRGTRLKDRSGNCRTIVCPYHGWVYETDGNLRAAPAMEAVSNFDIRAFGLKRFRLESFGGFLFINHNEDAQSLASWLGDMPETFSGHRLNELRCVKRFDFEVRANWKFLIGNALEAYHTGTVHKTTLGHQESEAVASTGNWDALFVSGAEDKSISTLPGELQPFPFIGGLAGKANSGTWFSVIYPCTQIVFSQDCVWWLDFKPVSVSYTKLTVGACFPADIIALDDFDERVAPYYHRWLTATPEDNAIAEAQQRGHNAGLNLAGRYSLSEHCVHALDNWVLDHVLDSSSSH